MKCQVVTFDIPHQLLPCMWAHKHHLSSQNQAFRSSGIKRDRLLVLSRFIDYIAIEGPLIKKGKKPSHYSWLKKKIWTTEGWNGHMPMLYHTSLASLESNWCMCQSEMNARKKVLWVKCDRGEIPDQKATNFPTVEGTELWKPAPLFLNLDGQQQ